MPCDFDILTNLGAYFWLWAITQKKKIQENDSLIKIFLINFDKLPT